jgi:3',5'-cyclic AMP phosphodiesterase CpdA
LVANAGPKAGLVGTAAGPAQPAAAVHLAAYLADEPAMGLPDLVRMVAIHDHAIGPTEASALFDARRHAVDQGGASTTAGPRFTAGPYLSPPGETSQGLLWETDRPADALVEWGETTAYEHQSRLGADRLHRFTFDGLKPDIDYYYRVTARFADGTIVQSAPLAFRSMPARGQPLVFGVLADTQERPFIALELSRQLWRQRPQLLVIAGDLIGGEEADRGWHWAEEYFAGVGPIAARVPVLAARGNGDVDVVDPATDLRLFTGFDRYHTQQDGGTGYFSRRIGDVEFFVLDGNLALRERQQPGFRQQQRHWLERTLAASDAPWKIAIHHQPAYSADADDYGDTAERPSTGGDPEIRRDFVDLYDRYGVDLVLSGHIHSYERSYPLRAGRPDPGGTVYVQLGGGGGDHEYPGPTRGRTAAALADGFHFGLVRLFAGRLEMTVSDVEGRMIDRFVLEARTGRTPAAVSPPPLAPAAAARNGRPSPASPAAR